MAHTTRALYRITRSEVSAVCTRTEHALGRVRRSVAESVGPIVDWRPDFAITHVLHYALEERGRLFNWQQFQAFCRDDVRAERMLWSPARSEIRKAVAHGAPPFAARAAMRWRIGNAYYSFLREICTIIELRHRGLDLRAHPLADAVFRVDAWMRDTVLHLYIRNDRFRDGEAGRKPRGDALLGGSGFRIVPIKLRTPTRYGRVDLPSPHDLDATAARLDRNR